MSRWSTASNVFATVAPRREDTKWSAPNVFNQVPYSTYENFIAVIARYKGTFLPLVLKKPLLWVLISAHFGIHTWSYWTGPLAPLDQAMVTGLPATLALPSEPPCPSRPRAASAPVVSRGALRDYWPKLLVNAAGAPPDWGDGAAAEQKGVSRYWRGIHMAGPILTV